MKRLFILSLFFIVCIDSFCQSHTYDAFLYKLDNHQIQRFTFPLKISLTEDGTYEIFTNPPQYPNSKLQYNGKYIEYDKWERLYKYRSIKKWYPGGVKRNDNFEFTTETFITCRKKLSDYANGLKIYTEDINEDYEINIEEITTSKWTKEEIHYYTIIPFKENKNDLSVSTDKSNDNEQLRIQTLNKIDLDDPIVMGANTFKQTTTFLKYKSPTSKEFIFDDLGTEIQYNSKSDKHLLPIKITKYLCQEIVKFSATFDNGTNYVFASSFDDFSICYNKDDKGYNESLKDYNTYYLGLYDFDDDKIDEIILATRIMDSDTDKNKIPQIELNVYKISSQNNRDTSSFLISKIGNIKGAGIEGKLKAFINNKTIKIPNNTDMSLKNSITWVNDKFIETSNSK